MSKESTEARRLDLSHWAAWPDRLWQGGALLVLVGIVAGFFSPEAGRAFASAYLTAFMFFTSLVLGSLFLVILHHLFDSQWLVPLRRFLEHIACQVPVLAILFVPVAGLALFGDIYSWTHVHDHSWHIKRFLYNRFTFILVSAALLGLWWWLGNALRGQSLLQDRDGAASRTRRMRFHSALGIFLFALSLTLASIFWMKSLEHQWFSTMYGVYYFAGSVWVTLATAWLVTLALTRTGHLSGVVRESTFKDLGTLFFAFTVFYAYIHFSQYFLIWNADIPEETYWYAKRDQGVWHNVGLLLIFGKFFVFFLALLRIDAKKSLTVMIPLCLWAWVMHYADMAFNVMPAVTLPESGGWQFLALVLCLGSMAFMGGLMARGFLRDLRSHPPYPLRDPRIAETLGVYVRPLSETSAASEGKEAGAQ